MAADFQRVVHSCHSGVLFMIEKLVRTSLAAALLFVSLMVLSSQAAAQG
jgi:hypothetical protein